MITINKTNKLRNVYCPVELRPHVFNVVEDDVRVKEDENGNCVYTVVGERNVFDYINSFKNGSSLSSMLDRISMLPVHEKVKYLQQCSGGITGDVSSLPIDGTEAFIALSHAKAILPDFDDLVRSGTKFDEIVNTIVNRYTLNKKESEVVDNGSIESSN